MKDEADNSEFLAPVCFHIDTNIEFKDVPSNGHEFLLKVIQERQSCPTVTKCKTDLTNFSSRQSVFALEVSILYIYLVLIIITINLIS